MRSTTAVPNGEIRNVTLPVVLITTHLSLARSAQNRLISLAIVVISHSICFALTSLLRRRLARYRRAAACIAIAGADVVTASRLIRAARDRACKSIEGREQAIMIMGGY